MVQGNKVSQLWLEKQITEMRAYSGIKIAFTMDSMLIDDLHIDSLELLELVTAIERYSERPLLDEIWMKWRRLQDVVDYLEQISPTNHG